MEKDIHVSHKGQGTATNREKGQGVNRTRAGAEPCKNGLARTLLYLDIQYTYNKLLISIMSYTNFTYQIFPCEIHINLKKKKK